MKIKLDLKVPRGWQQCTTAQLEMIAMEMMRATMVASTSRFKVYDWAEVKVRLFFDFTELTILRQEDDGVFICQHPSMPDIELPIETWQVHSWVDQNLRWLDDEKATMPKMLWPYPKRLWHRPKWWKPWHKEYYRPAGELLDGMKWRQYRKISDWMEEYVRRANALIKTREERQATAEQLRTLTEREREARVAVLSLIFDCPQARAAELNEVEWQVVMFWWSSMTQYLKEQYPKCFTSGKSKDKGKRRPKRQPMPIELYTRSMATLEKYLHLSEDQVNAEAAHNILRHLNDMAVEAEEMERIRRKRH